MALPSGADSDPLDAFRAELLRQKIVFDAELRRQREHFEDELATVTKALADRETDCRNLHAVISILGKKVDGLAERLSMIRSGTPQRCNNNDVNATTNGSRMPSPARSERSVYTCSTAGGGGGVGPYIMHRRASPGRTGSAAPSLYQPRIGANSATLKPPPTTASLQHLTVSASSSRAPSINQLQQATSPNGAAPPQPATAIPQPSPMVPRHVSPSRLSNASSTSASSRPKLTAAPKLSSAKSSSNNSNNPSATA